MAMLSINRSMISKTRKEKEKKKLNSTVQSERPDKKQKAPWSRDEGETRGAVLALENDVKSSHDSDGRARFIASKHL